MGKKRKSIASSLDEVDRSVYATFCSAANSLSQLYTQAMNQQRLSFQAGERHALEKLYQCIRRHQEGGSRVTTMDIVNYIQNELDYCGEEPAMSPRAPVQHQHMHPTTTVQVTNSGLIASSAASPYQASGHSPRPEQCDEQTKAVAFSNALSSTIRPSFQGCSQGACFPVGVAPSVTPPPQSNEAAMIQPQNRVCNSNDSTMDMHAE